MKNTFLALLSLAVASFAEPYIQVTAELTGAAAAAAKKLSDVNGERTKFPSKLTTKSGTGCSVELGQVHRYPATVDGKQREGRHVGIILRVEPKLQGDRITFTGGFYRVRLGASTLPTDTAVVATVFSSWECPFSGTAEPAMPVTIDLTEQDGLPSTLKLTFMKVEAQR
jgi:hypothetical protein